jgi:hypothetical protein
MANQVRYRTNKSALQKMYFNCKSRGRKILRLLPYKTHNFVIWLQTVNELRSQILTVSRSALVHVPPAPQRPRVNWNDETSVTGWLWSGQDRFSINSPSLRPVVSNWYQGQSCCLERNAFFLFQCAWSHTATPPLHRRGVLLLNTWWKQWLLNYPVKWTLWSRGGGGRILALLQFLHKIVVI